MVRQRQIRIYCIDNGDSVLNILFYRDIIMNSQGGYYAEMDSASRAG